MPDTEIDELIDAWQNAWADRDGGAFAAICHPEIHFEAPVLTAPLDGIAALTEHARQLQVAFPDVRIEKLGDRIVDDHLVAAPARVIGTHQGPLAGLPATNRMVTLPGVFYCQLDQPRSRLLRVRVFFDRWDAAVQLGVLPSHGTMGEKAMMMIRGFGLRGGR